MDRGGSTSIQLQYCAEHNKYFITTDYHLVTKQRGADSALGWCPRICNSMSITRVLFCGRGQRLGQILQSLRIKYSRPT